AISATTGRASSTVIASSTSAPAITPRNPFQGSGGAGTGSDPLDSLSLIMRPYRWRSIEDADRHHLRQPGLPSRRFLAEQRAGGDDRPRDPVARAGHHLPAVADFGGEGDSGVQRSGQALGGDHTFVTEALHGQVGQPIDR